MGNKQPSLAVYAGTFDPITNGHRDIIERAAKLFDVLIVAVAESSRKELLFSADERREMVEETAKGLGGNIRVEVFKGLLIQYLKEQGAHVIIRGLRAVSDYEYEAQMAVVNRRLAEGIETVFLMTSEKCSFISASIVREVARHGGDVSSLVSAGVADRLKNKFGKKK